MFENCFWRQGNPLMPPISIAAVYKRGQVRTPEKEYLEVKYGRENNPTVMILEETISCMENAEYGLAYNSGMAAIASLLHHARIKGYRILASRLLYGTTRRLLTKLIPEEKIRVKGPPWGDLLESIEWADLILLETIGNPTLRVPPLDEIIRECKRTDCILAVDNTFASPVSYRPLEEGATIVIESLTKYMGGHNDLLGGYTGVNTEELHESLWDWRRMLGTILQPLEAYQVYRGLRTLELRFKKSSQTALTLASRLDNEALRERVLYPCLNTHPDHDNALRLLREGCGGVFSIDLGSLEAAERFLQALEIISPAPSLGAVDSLASHPYTSSHRSMPSQEKEALGITPGLVRISVGVEDAERLYNDIVRALEKAGVKI